MAVKITPAEVQAEYTKGVHYKTSIDLYTTVEQNEDFYIGNHWKGINAPDLDKPVLNLLHRIVSFFVAMIVSDDIASLLSTRESGTEEILAVVNKEIENIIEAEKIKSKNRILVRNAAVDGDCCLYIWFDADAETGQTAKGTIRASIIDNTAIIFGNPQEREAQEQPYIIVPMRELVEDVKLEAEANNRPESEVDAIQEDTEPNEYNASFSPGGLVTTLIKLWKNPKTETVWAVKTCGTATTIREAWDTEYRLYPIAFMPWEIVKNSYHGASAIKGLIPNQIFINKLYAMAMHYVKTMAFPKFAYDKNYLPNGISNKVGEGIAVQGDPSKVIFKPLVQADMSNQVFVMIDKIIEHTKEFMGASDVAMGNVKPENTSAIIAVTKSSTIPLEMQRLNFYQFVEDYIRIILEIMATDYKTRGVEVIDADGNPVLVPFDFSILKALNFKMNIDVGMSSYWDEITQVQTMDNLWLQKVIQDPVDYLEGIPDHMIKNKAKLIQKLKDLQAAMAQLPPDEMGDVPPDMQGGEPPPPQQ